MVRALWRGLSLGGRRWNEVEGELGMKARGLRWYMVSVLPAVAVPLFLATGSFAVSVPVGAESRALLLDPLLRGGVTLAFLHPQQAALQPQQLFVLDTGGGDPYSSVGSASNRPPRLRMDWMVGKACAMRRSSPRRIRSGRRSPLPP